MNWAEFLSWEIGNPSYESNIREEVNVDDLYKDKSDRQ